MPKKVKGAAVRGQSSNKAGATGESVASYFRGVFEEKPRWLKSRSNDELLQRWLADHPGETTVPQRIKVIMANTKSVLRKKGRKGRGKIKKEQPTKAVAHQFAATAVVLATAPSSSTQSQELEQLEEQIDDCLTLAKTLDREQLANVIHLLRRARNGVVWKLGQ
jgi:hypothetical protein